MTGRNGPFDTADEARELPEVREIYRTYTPGSLLADGAQRLITQALDAAGVSMGAYDEALTRYIGGFEPQIAAVVASWVARASTAVTSAPAGGSYPTAGNAIPRPSGVLIVSSRLEAIRGVLEDTLPSATADRQAALERIEQIANTSRTESGVEAGGSASLLRADVATVLDALSTAAEYLGDRIALCPDCDAPAGLCGTCQHRLKRAEAFETLAELLRGAR